MKKKYKLEKILFDKLAVFKSEDDVRIGMDIDKIPDQVKQEKNWEIEVDREKQRFIAILKASLLIGINIIWWIVYYYYLKK